MPFSDSWALDTSAVTMAHDQQRITSSPVITPGRTDGQPSKNSNSFYRHNSPSSQSQDPQKQFYGDGEALTTRSAFEITSVSNAPPDGEDAEGHTSKDAEELKRSLLEVDDSMYYRVSTSSGESIEAINDDSQISLPNSLGTAAMTSMPNLEVPSNPSPKLFDPTGANGPQASGASRFRRINNYQRGRWSVTDIFEPEERSDSEMKMASTYSAGPKGDVQVGGAMGGDSNSLLPNVQRKSTNNLVGMDTQTHPQDGGLHHSRSSSEISNPQDTNLREQFILMDKQSSTAESIVSLSRTGSLSSVVKSVDEEERGSGDIDDIPEPTATHTPDLPRSTTSTAIDRTHSCSCEECSMEERRFQDQARSVDNALCHLHEQLNQFMNNNSYNRVIDETNRLSQDNTRLSQKVTLLENEIDRLRGLLIQHNIPVDPPT